MNDEIQMDNCDSCSKEFTEDELYTCLFCGGLYCGMCMSERADMCLECDGLHPE
jgi:predicted sulfurtransferase